MPTSSVKEVSEEIKPSAAESLEIELVSETRAQVELITTAPEIIPAEITAAAENSIAMEINISEYEKQKVSQRVELHPIKAVEVTEIITISKEQQIKTEITTLEEAEVKSVSEHVMFAPAEEIATAMDLVADQLVRQELEETTLHLSKEMLMIYLAETISHTAAETGEKVSIEEKYEEETIETATVDFTISQIGAAAHTEILQTAGKIARQTKGQAERVVTITDLKQLQRISPVREAIAELITSEVVETTEYTSQGLTKEIEESCETIVHASIEESIALNVPLVSKKKRLSVGENVNVTITVDKPESKAKKSVTFGMVPLETEFATIYLSREAYEESRVKVQVENPALSEEVEVKILELVKEAAFYFVKTTEVRESQITMDVSLVHAPEISIGEAIISESATDKIKLLIIETHKQQETVIIDQVFAIKMATELVEHFAQVLTIEKYSMLERVFNFNAAFEERMDTVIITLPARVAEFTALTIMHEEMIEISERSKESFSEVSVSISEDLSLASTISEQVEELYKNVDLSFEQLQKYGAETLLGLEKSEAKLSVKREKEETISYEFKTEKETQETVEALIAAAISEEVRKIVSQMFLPCEEVSADVAQNTTNLSTTEILLEEKSESSESLSVLRKGTVQAVVKIAVSKPSESTIVQVNISASETEKVFARMQLTMQKLEQIIIEEIKTVQVVEKIEKVVEEIVEEKISEETSSLDSGFMKSSEVEITEEQLTAESKETTATSKSVSLDKKIKIEETEQEIQISSQALAESIESVFGIKESLALEKRASFFEEKSMSSVSFIHPESQLSFDVALAQLIAESVKEQVEKIYKEEREGTIIIFEAPMQISKEEITLEVVERAKEKANIYRESTQEIFTDVTHTISGQAETVEMSKSIEQLVSVQQKLHIEEKKEISSVDIDIIKPEDEDHLDILLSLISEDFTRHTLGAEAIYIDVNIERKQDEFATEVNIEPTTGKVEGALEEQSINVDVDVAIPEDSAEVEFAYSKIEKEANTLLLTESHLTIEVTQIEAVKFASVIVTEKSKEKLSKFVTHEKVLMLELDVECIKPEDTVSLDIQLILIESEEARLHLSEWREVKGKNSIFYPSSFLHDTLYNSFLTMRFLFYLL